MGVWFKRSFAWVLAIVLVAGMLPGMRLTADAAVVDYKYGSYGKYTQIIKNWGEREELATFLSPNAEKFYQNKSYKKLSSYAGSSQLDQVHNSKLYQELNQLMTDAHTAKTSYGEAKYLLAFTDIEKNGKYTTQMPSFYSGKMIGPDWDGGKTWNREHTWPNSKGGDTTLYDTTRNNEADIIMLRPATSSENSGRNNTAYGVSSGYYDPNKTSNYVHNIHGDVARTILYVYVRWGTEEQAVLNNLWGKDGVIESLDVLLDWMAEDPVDTWEMGRNDSVESITGTRNVFVDYPELAFALFNRQIPQMQTPSGNAFTLDYTLSAVSGNTALGTVSVNGNMVTAHPVAGYQAAGYQVIRGSATVDRDGNIFTVNASRDCTVQINFEKIPGVTVSYVENGVLKSASMVQTGDGYTLPQYTGTVPENYTFVGWVTSEILSATPERPAKIYKAGDTEIAAGDTTYYSLLWYMNEDDQDNLVRNYERVDSADDLKLGYYYVVTAAVEDFAMGGIRSSKNNRDQVAITKNGNKLSFDPDQGVAELMLDVGAEGTTNTYSFYDSVNKGYLYAAGSNGNNHLKLQTTLDANGSFAITVNSDGSCTIQAQGSYNCNILRYNANNDLFSCYNESSTTMKNVSLYVGIPDQGTAYYVTEVESCQHINETVVVTAPTCTQEGYTTYTCTDCQYSYVGDYVAPAHTEVILPAVAATLASAGKTQGKYCSACKEVLVSQTEIPCLASVDSWGLILDDDLCVKFKIYVDASIATTAQIHIAVANEPVAYTTSQLTAAGNGYYYATVRVAAAQMGDTITVQIKNGSDASQSRSYSVAQYAKQLLADARYSKYHTLLKEMLHYGAAAQTYFDHNAANPVDQNITGTGSVEIPTASQQEMTVDGFADGVTFYGATLVYREKIALRFYFQGDVTGVTFAANGSPCAAQQKDDLYYVEISGILPQNLDQAVTLTATDAQGNTITVTYSPMNYMVRMNQKGSDQTKALLKALYNYHLAAKALA